MSTLGNSKNPGFSIKFSKGPFSIACFKISSRIQNQIEDLLPSFVHVCSISRAQDIWPATGQLGCTLMNILIAQVFLLGWAIGSAHATKNIFLGIQLISRGARWGESVVNHRPRFTARSKSVLF